jgi:hypothetical protein
MTLRGRLESKIENYLVEGTPESHPAVWLRHGLQVMYDAMKIAVVDPICIDNKYWDADDEDDGRRVLTARVNDHRPELQQFFVLHSRFLSTTRGGGAGLTFTRDHHEKLIDLFQEYIDFVKSMPANLGNYLRYPGENRFNASRDWQGGFKECNYLQRLLSDVATVDLNMRFTDDPATGSGAFDSSYRGRYDNTLRVLQEDFKF